jgi:hypothetical protein
MSQSVEKTRETSTDEPKSMSAEPQKEHGWLHKLVGEWEYEFELPAETDEPMGKEKGTESVRSLGGVWIVGEGQGKMPDGDPATTLLTLGYDPEKKRFVGTWIGSMMTHLWIYDGELDATGRVLTLDSEGPRMDGKKGMAHYQDVIEFKSEDHRTLTARVLGDDGKWQQMMMAHYRRKR